MFGICKGLEKLELGQNMETSQAIYNEINNGFKEAFSQSDLRKFEKKMKSLDCIIIHYINNSNIPKIRKSVYDAIANNIDSSYLSNNKYDEKIAECLINRYLDLSPSMEAKLLNIIKDNW